MKKIFLPLILLISINIFSQDSEFDLIEVQWLSILESKSIDEKLDRNDRFSNYILSRNLGANVFEDKKLSKQYDLNRLDQFSEMWSSDSTLKITSWFFALDEENYQYNINFNIFHGDTLSSFAYCYNSLEKQCGKDCKTSCDNENKNFKNEGYFYYDLIETKSDFDTYFTLIGWSKEGLTSQKKVMLGFTIKQIDNSICIVAANFIENTDNSYSSKRVFEYSAQTTMKLKYIEDQAWILMDHLSPPTSQYEGIFEFYGPDLSFDAYVWENNRWVYYADVDADKGINKKNMEFENPKKVLEEDKIYSPK